MFRPKRPHVSLQTPRCIPEADLSSHPLTIVPAGNQPPHSIPVSYLSSLTPYLLPNSLFNRFNFHPRRPPPSLTLKPKPPDVLGVTPHRPQAHTAHGTPGRLISLTHSPLTSHPTYHRTYCPISPDITFPSLGSLLLTLILCIRFPFANPRICGVSRAFIFPVQS